MAWVAVGLAVLLVAGLLAGYVAFREVFDKIHEVNVTGLGNRPPKFDRSLNILVIGSDTRQGKNARFGAHVGGQRSDTIMILHLSPGRKRATVLSIPRDSVVPVLNCPAVSGAPGQAAQPGQVEQINATFAMGGPGCLWKTVEHTAHIRLDHFMELNFTGFENVINDLGGVNICLPYAISDARSKLHLTSGLHHVWGSTALAYWRVRYIGLGSDLERIRRDQYLMASVAQEIRHTDLLGNPARMYRIVSDVAASLTTDSGLNQSAMISLARGLRTLRLADVRFIQVPTVPYAANPAWVNWAPSAGSLFEAIAHDRGLPGKHRAGHPRQEAERASSSAGRGATPAAGHSPAPTAPRGLSHAARGYGGITGGARACRDASAFAGPLGGH
ncbi:MAG TPA: LCP family protein [Streptosporangiaceae bacterium]|nr:LCP family protein [Streptosporangiaceae bacterium]